MNKVKRLHVQTKIKYPAAAAAAECFMSNYVKDFFKVPQTSKEQLLIHPANIKCFNCMKHTSIIHTPVHSFPRGTPEV